MAAHHRLFVLIAVFGVLAALPALAATDDTDGTLWIDLAACMLVQTLTALRARRLARPLALHVAVASAIFALANTVTVLAVMIPGFAAIGMPLAVSDVALFAAVMFGLAAVCGTGVVAVTAAVGRLETR
jgi:hypothetical protein